MPGENLPTVLETTQEAGTTTGNVSTAEITDATPAGLASHMSLRGCQGPADTAEDCRTETKALELLDGSEKGFFHTGAAVPV